MEDPEDKLEVLDWAMDTGRLEQFWLAWRLEEEERRVSG